MNLDVYPVVITEQHKKYEFTSEGPKGAIPKTVFFRRIGRQLFNLSFGDWNEVAESIDDRARTNNGDRDKVIATVASTVIIFFERYPEAAVVMQGSTRARTRLYQMGISINWPIISNRFIVKGLYKRNWEAFKPGKNYEAFLLELRQII